MDQSTWVCSKGESLLIPSGPKGMHLFVIVLDPTVLQGYGTSPQILLVSATTLRDDIPHDPACILEAGEHPFIQHRSYIAYRYARIDSAAHVEQMVARHVWIPKEACSPQLIDKIISGMQRSRLAPREFKKLLAG